LPVCPVEVSVNATKLVLIAALFVSLR
jgi:hypothetical protein